MDVKQTGEQGEKVVGSYDFDESPLRARSSSSKVRVGW